MNEMTELSIGTLNLWGRKGLFTSRMRGIFHELEKLDLDIICFQEVSIVGGRHGLISDLRSLGYEIFFAPTMQSDEGRAYGNAIASKLPLIQATQRELPADPNMEPRNAIFACIKSGAVKVQIACTHLSVGEKQNELRNQQLASILADPTLAPIDDLAGTILAGDLNSTPDNSDLFAQLSENGFTDCHGTEYDREKHNSFLKVNKNSISRGITDKLDYILCKRRKLSKHTIITADARYFAYSKRDDIFLSDHIGLQAKFSLSKH